ncbi:MAG: DUF4965 domain-containing protein [Endomicrobia bacterium]|nr:DUF4965 domain-containing protein [Endomicrobiia bacterium]
MSFLYETTISKLGGGFTLHFKPQNSSLYISPVGILCCELFDFILGLKTAKGETFLPFNKKDKLFEYLEQEISLTTLRYKAKSNKLGLILEVKFTAPFYPNDSKVSTAPFVYLDIFIQKIPYKYDDAKTISGKLILDVKKSKKDLKVVKTKTEIYMKKKFTAKFKVNKKTGLMDLVEDKLKTFTAEILFKSCENIDDIRNISFEVDKDKKFNTRFVIGMYCDDVIVVKDQKENFSFLYNYFFDNVKKVVDYAIINEKNIIEKTKTFESILKNSSLSKTQKDFISYSFQSYLMNTRWLLNKETNKDIFTVIEGNCGYHSTVDVEYNVSLFYLLFWPELLKKEILLWFEYIKKDWVPHDVGALFEVNGQVYPHNMEVEENCNLILLNYVYWKHTEDFSIIKENYNLLKKLVEFIIKCDVNKNGIPEKFTANTVDDAAAAVQFSREQVYLGIKTYSAFIAISEIARCLNDKKFFDFVKSITSKIKNTLEKKAWFKEHYLVCLDKVAKNLVDVWSGKKINGILEGWDAYSIYTANGLLYLLISDTKIDLDKKKIKLDIINSKKHNMLEYGCTHTSKDKSNIWISQNLWHDFVGMYFGLDFSDNIERYWQFELFENTQGRGGCFVDTYGWNHLHYYPRGVCSFGILFALGGVRIDAVKKVIKLSPVRVPLKIPLVSFADWEKGKIPVVEFYFINKKINLKIHNRELLKGYEIIFE